MVAFKAFVAMITFHRKEKFNKTGNFYIGYISATSNIYKFRSIHLQKHRESKLVRKKQLNCKFYAISTLDTL